MAKQLGPWKLNLDKDYYWDDKCPFAWVGHPQGGDAFVDRRKDMIIVGGITDDEASYSYDDWALVLLDNKYYLFSTSGCSCPSPTETWRVEKGPATIKEIREHVNSGNYEGYTLPKRQHQEFMEVLDFAQQNQVKSRK